MPFSSTSTRGPAWLVFQRFADGAAALGFQLVAGQHSGRLHQFVGGLAQWIGPHRDALQYSAGGIAVVAGVGDEQRGLVGRCRGGSGGSGRAEAGGGQEAAPDTAQRGGGYTHEDSSS
jgi:hypothetical protein